MLSDTIASKQEMLPASTFKIINLLIALETKTIKDEHEIIAWPGKTDTVKYGYRPDIYHDMSVQDAFKLSAGWVFVEIAKKIGKENYNKYLTMSNYGNGNLSHQDPDFWNFGKFGISVIEMVEFLNNLHQGNLPFSKKNIDIVKRVMLTEQNESYKIYSKTGWTREGGKNLGWWVGYMETKKGPYIFVTRLLQDRKYNTANFGSCRKDITLNIFKKLKLID